MPIVFVHGVTVRDSPQERERTRNRDANFQAFLPKTCGAVPVANPPWGKYGARFAWDLASMPRRTTVKFGGEAPDGDEIIATVAPGVAREGDDVLLPIAQRSVADAIDALWWSTALAAQEGEQGRVTADELGTAAKRALDYVRVHPDAARSRIAAARSDDQVVSALVEMAAAGADGGTPQEISFGAKELYDSLWNGASRLARRAAESAVARFREKGARALTLFIGDVLEYIDTRHRPDHGPIVNTIADAFCKTGTPLTIVGHSMGGVIAYDVLTHFARDVACKTFITVGSQVALFEELKKYRVSDDSIRGSTMRVAKPVNVDRWINVVDLIDPLAYLAEPVFSGVQDVWFGKAASPLSSHSDYFNRPEFYSMLADLIEPNLP